MTEALEVPLKDLEGWLEQELAPVIGPLKAEGASLFDDIRGRLNEFRGVCEKLLEDGESEMLKGNPKTYRSAREVNKLARNALETIDKVAIPDRVSRENLRMLREDLEGTLAAIGQERGKRFPRIEPYFILDRRRFDIALRRVMESLGALRTFSLHRYAKAKTLENVLSMIAGLFRLLDELDKAERRKKRMEPRRKVLEGKMREKRRDISAIQSKIEMRELVQINKRIEELEKKVKNDLSCLQKPFLKFQSLARGPDYYLPFNEAEKLGEYINGPFEALATEEKGYPMLKRVLQKMNDAMAQGKLKLKSSRWRKAQKRIRDIVQRDVLIPLHRNCRETFCQRQKLLTSKAVAAFQEELIRYQRELREFRRRKEFIDSRHALLDGECQDLLQKIKSQRKELEKTVLELTGKNVLVTIA